MDVETDGGFFMVDVILPAAGCGTRMDVPIAKQFVPVLGHPLLAYTVDSFHKLPFVRSIMVVVLDDKIDFAKNLLQEYNFTKVQFCAGSNTRHRSIFCGVQALAHKSCKNDVIIIHDAARPFVSKEIVEKVAFAAKQHGAAGVIRNLVSTVIRGDDDNNLVESLDRLLYRNSEMPQAFQLEIIKTAYELASEDDMKYGTECLFLVLKYCQRRPHLVEGTDELWKVTYRKDIFSMEATIKVMQIRVMMINRLVAKSSLQESLRRTLHTFHLKDVLARDDAANTFVVQLDDDITDSCLEKVAAVIKASYNKLPYSAVKLGAFVLMLFVNKYEAHEIKTRSDDGEHYKVEDVDSNTLKQEVEIRQTLKLLQSKLKAPDFKVCVTGVLCCTDKNISPNLQDVIWNRSSYLDGHLITLT